MAMKRVCVLGHRGMLGHVTARVLELAGWDVQVVRERFQMKESKRFVEAILSTQSDWYVNCIGLRPGTQVNPNLLMEINGYLAKECLDHLPSKLGWIHASSDGVFAPDRPQRGWQEKPDARDDYGISKIMGEEAVLKAGRKVIRCSMIGPEMGPPRSLMGWFLSQTKPVIGYTNHLWNGITTLRWAQICLELMEGRHADLGQLVQPGFMDVISKYDLLRTIRSAWNHAVEIRPVTSDRAVWRTLVPNLPCPPIPEQLRTLREWYVSRHIE